MEKPGRGPVSRGLGSEVKAGTFFLSTSESGKGGGGALLLGLDSWIVNRESPSRKKSWGPGLLGL